ncbi:hypothetical protein Fot_25400 [Forsythia ovata]|uniref:WIT1/2 N-terminal helical bundle domain-containing protein n=1 Tax=Forsythia ovata TaxID=205694 RepID=A0ABD1U932_9LAMI
MDELELELQTSAGESRKFEELHKESGLHAESETKMALEFKRLLELAESSAKEMEDQMACMQLELKSLYEKIAENQKVEEVLKSTTAKLSTVHWELDLSKSQVQEVGQRLASKETLINELTQELELKSASESKAIKDITALEN